jgi:hypothetical protein
MKIMMKKLVYLLFVGLFPVFLTGQNIEIGVGLGAVNYWGDLNAPSFSKNLTNARFGVQINGRIIYTKHLAGRLNVLIGGLEGDDSKSDLDWQQLRNLSFKSNLFELSLIGEYYPFGNSQKVSESLLSPFLAGGIGVFTFNPYADYEGQEIELQPLGTEGQGIPGYDDKYSTTSFALLFGGGAKFLITNSINLSVEVIARRTFTDYIDDVSSIYVNYNELLTGNGIFAAELGNRMDEFIGQSEPVQLPTGTQRGGVDVKDYYLTGMVTLNFVLGGGSGGRRGYHNIECPTF